MAKQPEASGDKAEGGAAAFMETMRRLVRVKKDDVKALERAEKRAESKRVKRAPK